MFAFLGLSFSHMWDLTSAGTLALALATFLSLLFANKSLAQTQREIELSRSEVEEAHRPVIVPVLAKTFVDLGADGRYEKRPQLLRDGKLLVHVENIGPGPALNIAAWACRLDDAEGSTGSDRAQRAGAQAAGLGPHADTPLLIDMGNWTHWPNFSLRVEYSDVASNGWRTDSVFVAGVYEVTGIDRCQRTRLVSRMIEPAAMP